MSILFAPCQLWPNFVDFLYLLCMLLLVTITNSDNTNTGSLQLTPTTQQKLLQKLENARTVPIYIWRWIWTKVFLWGGLGQRYFYEADLDKRRMFSYLHFYEKQSRWCQTNISNKKASNFVQKSCHQTTIKSGKMHWKSFSSRECAALQNACIQSSLYMMQLLTAAD